VLSYLEIRKGDFYHVETTTDGKRFVTARGWDDLSQIITLYERNGLTVDEDLIGQYLQYRKISKNFAAYYDLFNKYRSDYQVEEILAGLASDEIKERAQKANFDERLSLIGLLLEAVTAEVRDVHNEKKVLEQLLGVLKQFRAKIATSKEVPAMVLEQLIASESQKLAQAKKAGSIAGDKQIQAEEMLTILEGYRDEILLEQDAMNAFGKLKMNFDWRVTELKQAGMQKGDLLHHLFTFAEEVFSDGHELLMIVTELTTNPYTAKYISEYGCPKYMEHSNELLFYERQKNLIAQLDALDFCAWDEA